MTPRQRLQATLDHKPVDRVCLDFGSSAVTGMGAGAVHRLRQALFGDADYRVKVIEPYQMLGQIDDELRQALQIDVVGVPPAKTMFGFPNKDWKPFVMNDGTPVLIPGDFQFTTNEEGGLLIYPQGDRSVPPSALMPKSSYFFDSINRQLPIDEDKLDPADNCEEFVLLGDDDLKYIDKATRELYENTDLGIYLTLPGMAFGDIALVPAPWLKHPKGIRAVDEWYMSLAMRQDYVLAIFDKQVEIALANIRSLAPIIGDRVQVVFVSGTDFGTQRSPFCSVATFRKLFKPYFKAVNEEIHRLTKCKTFVHSCGAIYPLIPELIDSGFDILNPIQVSANGMDASRLKKEFGDSIVFWGGGVDTQQTLPFGTPDEVYRQVSDRISILGEGSGFVFNSTHNIQSNVPVENILSMFKAIRDKGAQ